jgi:F0F1-type ATP synthase membrane subunit b/b'
MPQFDYSNYSSQIFWFLICFTILFFVSRTVILPRIKNILEERNKIIESNKLQSFEIENDIEKLNSKIKSIKS